MSKSAISKVTSKGQITVPEAIRERLQIQEGDRLEWEVTGEGTAIVRKSGRSLSELVGLLGAPKRSASIEQLDEAVRERIRRGRRARR